MSRSTTIFTNKKEADHSTLLEESTIGACVLTHTPPPRSKPISHLFIPTIEKQKRTSAHDVQLVYKVGTDKAYFFKKVNPNTPNSEIEALCGAIGKFRSPDKVPSMHTVHDDHNTIIGVISRAIPNFKPNSQDPLKKEDTTIEILSKEIIELRKTLLESLKEYLPMINRKPVSTGSSPTEYAGYLFIQAKNTLVHYTDLSGNTAVVLSEQLNGYMESKEKFTMTELKSLTQSLTLRLKNPNIQSDEEKKLHAIINIADKLLNLRPTTNITFTDVEKLEQLNQKVADKGYVLEHINENTILPEAILDDNFQVTVKSLRCYRIAAGLGRGLPVAWLGNNDDNHNGNLSKDGMMIDFDMYRFDTTYQFKMSNDEYSLANLYDWITRTPKEGQYQHTTFDIEHFPIVKSFKAHFWVTKATDRAKSSANNILEFTQNYFTKEDNQTYQQLGQVSAFIFHFYIRLLKTVLIDSTIYQELAALEMRENNLFDDITDRITLKNLRDTLVNAEIKCSEEVRQSLIKSIKFKEFMSNHGDFAFKLVYDEFAKQKKRYQEKLERKPYYKGIHEAINLDNIKENFEQFKIDIGVKNKAGLLR